MSERSIVVLATGAANSLVPNKASEMDKLLEREREQADTFAKLAGFQCWEDAVEAAKTGLQVRATLPVYLTVKLQSPFGIGEMSSLASRFGLELVFDGADPTPTGEAEYWRLLKAGDKSIATQTLAELEREIRGG